MIAGNTTGSNGVTVNKNIVLIIVTTISFIIPFLVASVSIALPTMGRTFDMDAVVGKHMAGLGDHKKVHPRLQRKVRAQALVDNGRLGPGNAALQQRMERLRGSNIEAQMITPEVMLVM